MTENWYTFCGGNYANFKRQFSGKPMLFFLFPSLVRLLPVFLEPSSSVCVVIIVRSPSLFVSEVASLWDRDALFVYSDVARGWVQVSDVGSWIVTFHRVVVLSTVTASGVLI